MQNKVHEVDIQIRLEDKESIDKMVIGLWVWRTFSQKLSKRQIFMNK